MMLVEIGFAWELQRGGRKRRLDDAMNDESGAAAEEGPQLLQDINEGGSDQVRAVALPVEMLCAEKQLERNPNIILQATTGDNANRKPQALPRSRNTSAQALAANGYNNQGSPHDMEGAHPLARLKSSPEGTPYAAANIPLMGNAASTSSQSASSIMGNAVDPLSQSASSIMGNTSGLAIALSHASQRNPSFFNQQRFQERELPTGLRLSLETPVQYNAHAALNAYKALRMNNVVLEAMLQRQQQHLAALLSQTRPQENGRVALPRAQQLPLPTTRNLAMVLQPAAMHTLSGRINLAPTSVVPSLVERGTGHTEPLPTMLDTVIIPAPLMARGIGNRCDVGRQRVIGKDHEPPPGGTS
jgi:hypothetical protein